MRERARPVCVNRRPLAVRAAHHSHLLHRRRLLLLATAAAARLLAEEAHLIKVTKEQELLIAKLSDNSAGAAFS